MQRTGKQVTVFYQSIRSRVMTRVFPSWEGSPESEIAVLWKGRSDQSKFSQFQSNKTPWKTRDDNLWCHIFRPNDNNYHKLKQPNLLQLTAELH